MGGVSFASDPDVKCVSVGPSAVCPSVRLPPFVRRPPSVLRDNA